MDPSASVNAEEAVSVLVNKTWKLFRASPMFNFSLQRANLERYADNLTVQVNSEILKKGSSEGGNNEDEDEDSQVVKLTTASFTVVPGFDTEKDEPEAVVLSISYQSKGRGASEEGRSTTFTAVLCSAGNPQVVGRNRTRVMAHRPLVFTKGPLRLTHLVNLWLESNFDCRIYPFRFLPVELSLMAAHFSAEISDSDNDALKKPFEFVYGFPDTIKDLTQMTLTIPMEAVQSLWKSIDKTDDMNDTLGEIEQGRLLLEAIEGHFFHYFHINLASLKLLRLGTPVCHIGSDGRIKFFSRSLTHQVLKHLTALAITELAKVN